MAMPRGSSEASRIRLKCVVLGAAGAGKTSILRRYFHDTFHSQRMPTQGSDFYTGRVQNPHFRSKEEEKKELEHHNNTPAPYILLQIWDTAGRERFAAGRKAIYTAALGDDFFRHADAAMLVYDATSSTSFTQLLKWHADLMERMRHLKKPFPVLIVANKMDIFKRELAEPRRRQSKVPQRDVLGLYGTFRGKDCPYEYRASPPAKQQTKNSRRVEISTYMATGDTWTTDAWYLDSVLNTEDRSHPDRDMVLLWCMRNGLKHFEVSALDGTGIDAAMEGLVSLALESVNEREQKRHEIVSQKESIYQSNKPLDIHQRYATKDDECKCWHPFRRR